MMINHWIDQISNDIARRLFEEWRSEELARANRLANSMSEYDRFRFRRQEWPNDGR